MDDLLTIYKVLNEKQKFLFLNLVQIFIEVFIALSKCKHTELIINQKTITKIPHPLHNAFWYKKFLLPFLKRLPSEEIVKIEFPKLQHKLKLRTNTSDIDVFEQIFINREYDFDLPNYPDLIIDGGANIGLASIFFANMFPETEIIAVEPDYSNFEILKQNVTYYKNIQPQRSAIWSRNCYLKAEDTGGGKWMIEVKETDKTDSKSFKSLTIDNLLENRPKNSHVLLKLDVEGSEKEIFSSDCHRWLKSIDMIIIELHDRLIPGCKTAFNNAVEPYGYKRVSKGENILLFKS